PVNRYDNYTQKRIKSKKPCHPAKKLPTYFDKNLACKQFFVRDPVTALTKKLLLPNTSRYLIVKTQISNFHDGLNVFVIATTGSRTKNCLHAKFLSK
ncbi:MAG TPA: hypothetical protein VLI69_00525, partial [Gammaproteobacteria bacterium]|nr:hypothetical protein [Gammaproteobacteria bacterium]